MTKAIFTLRGVVQHYDWGGTEFIPALLGMDNPEKKPFAELWMGAHPAAPSMLLNGTPTPLDAFIAQYSVSVLGERVAAQFHQRLPYLFKVLDVHKMLSIQAHPDKAQAEAGFDYENKQGIPLNAPHRNYKDDNHKPEVMAALTEFWLLHGFKSLKDIQQTLLGTPEFESLRPLAAKGDIYQLYKFIMEMSQEEVDAILQPLHRRLSDAQPHKSAPDYWAKRAFTDHPPRNGHYDRGIFSIYLMNLLHLQPGEGIFQAAGIPHAYLEGVNVELMANSDNVFRGGLTNKHVDVPELLKNLRFDSVTPHIIRGEALSSTELAYRTPAPDFELRQIMVSPDRVHYCALAETPQILIVMEGTVRVNYAASFSRGRILFAPAGATYALQTESPQAVLFKAIVP